MGDIKSNNEQIEALQKAMQEDEAAIKSANIEIEARKGRISELESIRDELSVLIEMTTKGV